jgi:streptogramin lyase
MKYRIVATVLVLALAACGGNGGSSSTSASNALPAAPAGIVNNGSSFQITEYSLGATPSVGGIAIAQDGSVWTQAGKNQNGQLVRWLNGSVTAYPVSDSSFYGLGIMTSTGQNIFGGFQNDYSGNYENLIASIPGAGGTPQFYQNSRFNTGSGVYGELADLTHLSGGSVWQAISDYQDGVTGQGIIQEVTPGNTTITLASGENSAQEYTYTLPTALSQGPDGNLWASEQDDVNTGSSVEVADSAIRVYSTAGALLHSYSTPFFANGMVTGPDGALWFTGNNGLIGRMTATGTMTTYTTNTTTNLGGIAVGGDGALWFLEPQSNMVGRITTSGTVTSYAIPTPNSLALGIGGPPPGCVASYVVWFAESATGKIAMVSPK